MINQRRRPHLKSAPLRRSVPNPQRSTRISNIVLKKEDSESGEEFSKELAEVDAAGTDNDNDEEEEAPKKKTPKKPAAKRATKKAKKVYC